MGMTYVEGIVTGPNKKRRSVTFLVDSGAKYTLLPWKDWRALGLKGKRTLGFVLADGATIERRISECHIRLPEGEGRTPVVLGERGDEALLGVITLEQLGFVLNLFNRTLQPARLMMA